MKLTHLKILHHFFPIKLSSKDDLTWCVPKAKLVPTWLNVFMIFSLSTWAGILVTLIISASALHFFAVKVEKKYNENFLWSLLIALSFTISTTAHYWPNRFFIKVFLGGLIFYGMHINTAYSSFLISVLTKPRHEPQISNLESAIQSNMVFKGSANTYTFFMKDDKVRMANIC